MAAPGFDQAAEPAFPADAVEVGRIIGAWGVKGGIKVKPLSTDPQARFSSKRWFLQPAEAPRSPRPAAADWPTLLRVKQAREHGDGIVAMLDGFDDRNAVEPLAGGRIFVSRASFPTPEADEFYWVDLIGLEVRNREQQLLGTVANLIETGPTCVLRILPAALAAPVAGSAAAGAAAAESAQASATPAAEPEDLLIPFVAAYVDRVDLPGRCIHVDWQADY